MNELLFCVLVFVLIIFSFAGAFVFLIFKSAFLILADEQMIIVLNDLANNMLNLMEIDERINGV